MAAAVRGRPKVVLLGAMIALTTSGAPGCRQAAEKQATDSLGDSTERGPLKLVVEASPAHPWIGDPVHLQVRMHTPTDFVVQFPGAKDFGDLPVRRLDADQAVAAQRVENGLEWTARYELDTVASGPVEIPPIVIKYAHAPADPAAKPEFSSELASSTLRVEVRSALTTQDSIGRPRDISGTLALPKAPLTARQWAAIAGGSLLILAALAGVGVMIRNRLRRPAPLILPEIWALEQLGAMRGSDPVGTGRVREYYYRLSEIVRRYIELKFSLAAPERTTEEFLALLARDRKALHYDARKLGEFLEACDIVKYAAFTPIREDADAALSTATAFVHATAAAAESARRAAGGAHAAGGGQAA